MVRGLPFLLLSMRSHPGRTSQVGAVGQLLNGREIFIEEFKVGAPVRSILLCPDERVDTALRAFCVDSGVAIESVKGQYRRWRGDTFDELKLRMLGQYLLESGGTLYVRVPVGGAAAWHLWPGCREHHVDAVRLYPIRGGAREAEGVYNLAGNEKRFYGQLKGRRAELIQVPRTHYDRIPRQLNRGVHGSLHVGRYMLERQYEGVKVDGMVALCGKVDDAIRWGCEKGGIKVVSLVGTIFTAGGTPLSAPNT
jgi:hypothetical protein